MKKLVNYLEHDLYGLSFCDLGNCLRARPDRLDEKEGNSRVCERKKAENCLLDSKNSYLGL